MNVTILPSPVMSPRLRYTFWIDRDLEAGLKALKARDGVPEAEAIRRAIGDFLAKKGIATSGKAERKRGATRSRS